MVRRALTFALLFSISSFGAGAALAQDKNAAAIVTEIYGSAGPSGHYRRPLAIFSEAPLKARYLSHRLQAELADMEKRTPADESPNLDFNVIADNQSPDVSDLKIATETENDAEAVVVVDFKSHDDKERSVLRFELVSEDGAWKIDDISASGKNHWRVSELLAGE